MEASGSFDEALQQRKMNLLSQNPHLQEHYAQAQAQARVPAAQINANAQAQAQVQAQAHIPIERASSVSSTTSSIASPVSSLSSASFEIPAPLGEPVLIEPISNNQDPTAKQGKNSGYVQGYTLLSSAFSKGTIRTDKQLATRRHFSYTISEDMTEARQICAKRLCALNDRDERRQMKRSSRRELGRREIEFRARINKMEPDTADSTPNANANTEKDTYDDNTVLHMGTNSSDDTWPCQYGCGKVFPKKIPEKRNIITASIAPRIPALTANYDSYVIAIGKL